MFKRAVIRFHIVLLNEKFLSKYDRLPKVLYSFYIEFDVCIMECYASSDSHCNCSFALVKKLEHLVTRDLWKLHP